MQDIKMRVGEFYEQTKAVVGSAADSLRGLETSNAVQNAKVSSLSDELEMVKQGVQQHEIGLTTLMRRVQALEATLACQG
eukprot:11710526-Karenia_brevis.AAC.1